MHTLYDLTTGPLLWLAIIVFIGGSIYKLVSAYQEAKKKDVFVVEYWSWTHVFRSFAHWFNPMGTERWRTMPVLAFATFIFHALIVITPLFLTGHSVLLEQWTGIGWPSLPAGLTDLFTIIVMVICGYFLWRRMDNPVAKYMTDGSDYFLLGTVFATFLTGFLAYHQIGDSLFVTTLHFLCGEAFLIMIPFTRANHALTGLFMRGYMASEFGSVRKCMDW